MVALHVCQVWWTLAYKPLRTRRHKSRRTLCQGRTVRACVHSVGMLCGYMPNSSWFLKWCCKFVGTWNSTVSNRKINCSDNSVLISLQRKKEKNRGDMTQVSNSNKYVAPVDWGESMFHLRCSIRPYGTISISSKTLLIFSSPSIFKFCSCRPKGNVNNWKYKNNSQVLFLCLLSIQYTVFYCCLHFASLLLRMVCTMMKHHYVVMALWWNLTPLGRTS